jgi:hypothetical protein
LKKWKNVLSFTLILLLLMPASAYAGEWKEEEDIFYNNHWYYYENGSPVMGQWKKIGGYWYNFRGDGALVINGWTIDGYFVNSDGVWLPDWGKLSLAGLKNGTYEYVGDDFADTLTVELYGAEDTGDGFGRADIAHYKRGYYGAGGNGTDTWYESYGDIYDNGIGSEDNPKQVYCSITFQDTGSTYTVYPLAGGSVAVEKDDVWRIFKRIQ